MHRDTKTFQQEQVFPYLQAELIELYTNPEFDIKVKWANAESNNFFFVTDITDIF